jgi:predicted Zn-dependent protease
VIACLRPLVVLILILNLAACQESPTGRKRLALIPNGQMAQMGDRAFQEMVREQPLVSDPRAKQLVACVTRALVDALPPEQAGGRWSVALFQDGTPNAFALPGGKIGVNAGMLRVARGQDQLAAVVAHEIAHVTAHHGNERMTQELAVQGGLMLADLLAENPGSREHELLRSALGLGAQYGLLLPYSRTHEREADLLGLDLMARAGFDPRESLTLWRNMAQAGGGQPLEFLSTHPSHETRLQELAEAMDGAMVTYREARSQGRRPECG